MTTYMIHASLEPRAQILNIKSFCRFRAFMIPWVFLEGIRVRTGPITSTKKTEDILIAFHKN